MTLASASEAIDHVAKLLRDRHHAARLVTKAVGQRLPASVIAEAAQSDDPFADVPPALAEYFDAVRAEATARARRTEHLQRRLRQRGKGLPDPEPVDFESYEAA